MMCVGLANDGSAMVNVLVARRWTLGESERLVELPDLGSVGDSLPRMTLPRLPATTTHHDEVSSLSCNYLFRPTKPPRNGAYLFGLSSLTLSFVKSFFSSFLSASLLRLSLSLSLSLSLYLIFSLYFYFSLSIYFSISLYL